MLRYAPVLSRTDIGWSGAHGHVQQMLLAMQPDLKNAAVYACGSDAMIYSAKELPLRSGLPVERFYSDAFVCSSSDNFLTGKLT